MTESGTVVHNKYTTVNIPVKLFARIERVIEPDKEFKTVTDYVTFVLREVVMAHAAKDSEACFDSVDLQQLKNRLEALGAL
jgi:hypothetical protein